MFVRIALILGLAGGMTLSAQSPPADWTALTVKLTQAADAGDVAGLKAARAAALRAVVKPAAGVPPAIAHYTLAFADYRLAADTQVPGGEQQGFADEAEQHLHDAIAANDTLADAHALLSAVLGLKIGWAASVEAKIAMGPASGAALARAHALEPANPRVLLIQGLGLFHRPVEYGGDPQGAEELFRRAADALDAVKDAPWPNWGRFDAHVWLGQALAQRGDAAGARKEYEKALAIAPDSAWIKYSLMPAVTKKIVE